MSYYRASFLGVLSRFVSAGCRLVSMPLTLGLLDNERYGIWLIMSSILMWLALTDLGIPSALQNPLVESWSRNDLPAAARLIRYATRLLSWIGLGIALACAILVSGLPVAEWLNIQVSHHAEFKAALLASIILVCVGLPLRVTGILAYATRRAHLPPLADITTQLLSLGLLAFFAATHFSSLFALVFAVSLVQLVVNLGLNRWLLRDTGVGACLASAGKINDLERRNLKGKGVLFLLVLVGEGLVLQSDAFVIGAMKDPAAITAYLVPHTLFMQFFFLQNAFLRPSWALFTEANALGDRSKAVRLLRRGLLLTLGASFSFAVGFLVFGDWFIRLWTHNKVELPGLMAWGFGAYIIVAAVGNLLAMFCNAVGLVGKRLYGILLFGAIKVLGGYVCLKYFSLEALPIFYAVICLFTDVLILSIIVFTYSRSARVSLVSQT